VVAVEPGAFGATVITDSGLVSDLISGPYVVHWKLNQTFASSDALPGVRIPNAAFPGILTTLPGRAQLDAFLERERRAKVAGETVAMPLPVNAAPAALCGPEGRSAAECLRTIPPREHGGNMDSRYLRAGAAVYLPCYVDGCGLAVGDAHYAQGDGELSGTAIEMDATVLLRAEIVRDMTLPRGPHYEGPASLLAIPSSSFYATTGLSAQALEAGKPRVRSDNLTLAARNALLAMIDHMVARYGLTREQAYIVASVAVDLRISQLVNSPNLGVSALLPTDIFFPRKP
jgi:formamidase